MKKYLKWFGRIALGVALIGTIVYITALHIERKDLLSRLDKSSQKNEMLLRKVREDKSKISAMMHKSRTVETQQGKLRKQNRSLEEKCLFLEAAKVKQQEKLESEKMAHAREIEKCAIRFAALNNEKKNLETEYNDYLKVIDQLDKAILSGQKDRTSLNAKLKRTKIKLTRCEENNTQLCEMSESLLDTFEHQGVLGSILKNESFVQLKRVEVEKLIHEYQDKIEELNIEAFH